MYERGYAQHAACLRRACCSRALRSLEPFDTGLYQQKQPAICMQPDGSYPNSQTVPLTLRLEVLASSAAC
jgi:hypothetical protein